MLILDEPMVDQDLSEKLSMLDTIAAAVDVSDEVEGSVLVRDVLSLLTQQQRAVITATILEGATEGETAMKLGISQQAVNKVKERAWAGCGSDLSWTSPPASRSSSRTQPVPHI